MHRTVLIGILVLAALGIATALAFASGKEKTILSPVTVALKGVECPTCAVKLQKSLARVTGVSEVKATFKPAQVTAKIDENKITASQFTWTVAASLAKIERNGKTGATLMAYIDTNMCAGQETMCKPCFVEIPKTLKTVKGVKDVTLDAKGKIAAITFTTDAKVTTATLGKALKQHKFGFTTQFVAPTAKTTDTGSACPHSDGGSACH